MANSFQDYTTPSGVQSITIDFLDPAHLSVIDKTTGNNVPGDEYTINVSTDPPQIDFTTAQTNNVRLLRTTPKANLLNLFDDGSTISSESLNDQTKQVLFVLQELEEVGNAAGGFSLDPTGTYWDAQTFPVANASDIDRNDALVTREFVDNVFVNNNANAATSQSWIFNSGGLGVGGTNYKLINPRPASKNAYFYIVTVDGVLQTPVTDYTINDNDQLVLASTTTAEILVRNFGTARNVFSDPLRTDSLTRDTLRIRKVLNQTSNLVLVEDNSGSEIFSIDADGNVSVTGGDFTYNGSTVITSAATLPSWIDNTDPLQGLRETAGDTLSWNAGTNDANFNVTTTDQLDVNSLITVDSDGSIALTKAADPATFVITGASLASCKTDVLVGSTAGGNTLNFNVSGDTRLTKGSTSLTLESSQISVNQPVVASATSTAGDAYQTRDQISSLVTSTGQKFARVHAFSGGFMDRLNTRQVRTMGTWNTTINHILRSTGVPNAGTLQLLPIEVGGTDATATISGDDSFIQLVGGTTANKQLRIKLDAGFYNIWLAMTARLAVVTGGTPTSPINGWNLKSFTTDTTASPSMTPFSPLATPTEAVNILNPTNQLEKSYHYNDPFPGTSLRFPNTLAGGDDLTGLNENLDASQDVGDTKPMQYFLLPWSNIPIYRPTSFTLDIDVSGTSYFAHINNFEFYIQQLYAF